MVPGDVDHPHALARLAQDLLDDVVVRLLPVPVIFEPPAINDVAYKVEKKGNSETAGGSGYGEGVTRVGCHSVAGYTAWLT